MFSKRFACDTSLEMNAPTKSALKTGQSQRRDARPLSRYLYSIPQDERFERKFVRLVGF
jgi:hypothetical protein